MKEQVLSKYEGSWVENKTHTLCVHVRHVRDNEQKEAMKEIEKLTIDSGFGAFRGHGSIECKPKNSANKGKAALEILGHMYGASWENTVGAIYIGDDTTDEDAMEALKGKGLSIRIFESKENTGTNADLVLTSSRNVVHFLNWFQANVDLETPVKVSTDQEELQSLAASNQTQATPAVQGAN